MPISKHGSTAGMIAAVGRLSATQGRVPRECADTWHAALNPQVLVGQSVATLKRGNVPVKKVALRLRAHRIQVGQNFAPGEPDTLCSESSVSVTYARLYAKREQHLNFFPGMKDPPCSP